MSGDYCCLEVYTEVEEQCIVVSRDVIAIHEVGDTKLIADFEIELVVLCTATKLKAHVVTVRTELILWHCFSLILIL